MDRPNKVVVIGGGAAGMMAAYSASKYGADVTLIEKNEKTGKKIYITGKGRCNLTNDCEAEDFFKNIVSNPKFMFSAYYGFDSTQVMDLMESAGCPLKVERGNRVFPLSDHASDVISALGNLLKKNNVNICLNTEVTSVSKGCVYTNKGSFEADSIIIATGGLSYPLTGSTGTGYKWAENLGHSIKTPNSALVPVETVESDASMMQGLSLKNVSVKVYKDKKILYKEFGEMLFTHFGLSGPLILSASGYYAKAGCPEETKISIDLKPALDEKQLDDRIRRDFEENINKCFKNSLDKLLPQKMIPVVIGRLGIDEDKKVNEITREERLSLCHLLKNFEYTISKCRSFSEAIITQGGVNVKEINPSTMESKLVAGIYFAGEIIDVDALTGGFNLQVAWSTGYLAGMSAATKEIC